MPSVLIFPSQKLQKYMYKKEYNMREDEVFPLTVIIITHAVEKVKTLAKKIF